MKRLIVFVLLALGMPLISACNPDAPEQPTREELAAQSEHLAGAMLSWEMQTDAERAVICAKALTRGQLGTQKAWQAKSGGTLSEWAPATSWLLRECESAGYGS